MKRHLLAAALAAALTACATAPAATEVAATGADAIEECRKGEPTGSRIVKKECKTRAEWAKLDREAAARNAAMLDQTKENSNPYTMQ